MLAKPETREHEESPRLPTKKELERGRPFLICPFMSYREKTPTGNPTVECWGARCGYYIPCRTYLGRPYDPEGKADYET